VAYQIDFVKLLELGKSIDKVTTQERHEKMREAKDLKVKVS
jgi:hypothetical protein